ncbi:MAG: hypothetical protein R3275_02035 [Saprospiraceae bacterium]|nr:hypothetical protein [Saprospiraceae bacterium]
MKDIADLVSIVCRFKPRQINVIDDDKDDKANLLYQLIVDNRSIDQEKAANEIYGQPSSSAFSKLKIRLREKLYNTLFFIDLRGPKFSNYMKASLVCYRYKTIFFILRRFGANHLATRIGEKTVKKALEFDMTEVSYAILSELCLYYSSESFNDKKYTKYKKLLDGEFKKLTANHLMTSVYAEIFAMYTKTRSSKKEEVINILENHLDQIRELIRDSDSFWLNRKGYLLLTLYYQIKGDLDEALKVCDKALHFFTDVTTIQSNVTIVNFYIQQLNIYLNQKRFNEGHRIALKAKNEVVYYSNDWHVLSYLHFLLCMHCKQYDKAIELYLEVTQHEGFKKLNTFFKESWSIFEAYVHLVRDKAVKDYELPRFSINKYVNNIPRFSKDKRGNNITILVAQFIFLVRQNKFSDVIDRVDALKQYAHRYLREDATLRSNCFIKMLLCVVRANFHPTATKRYAEKYINKLYNTSPTVSEQSTEIEIMPYEDLWELIMDMLEEKA